MSSRRFVIWPADNPRRSVQSPFDSFDPEEPLDSVDPLDPDTVEADVFSAPPLPRSLLDESLSFLALSL
jgi:hypothetical protein